MRQVRRELLDKGKKTEVEEHVAALGVVDDVADLLGEQAWVHRMQDSARTGDAEIQLEVPEPVPGQSGDPLARPDAEAPERPGQSPRACAHLGIVAAVDGAVAQPGDDLGRAMVALGIGDQA